MAISVVGTPVTAHNEATTSALDMNVGDVLIGDRVIILGNTFDVNAAAGAVTDAALNSYNRINGATVPSHTNFLALFESIVASNTTGLVVSLQPTGGGSYYRTAAGIIIRSTTGWQTGTDDHDVATSGVGTPSANPVSPAVDASATDTFVVIGVCDGVSDAAYTQPGAPWTGATNDDGGGAHNSLVTAYRILTAPASGITGTWTRASTDWATIAAVFKAVASGSNFVPDEDYEVWMPTQAVA